MCHVGDVRSGAMRYKEERIRGLREVAFTSTAPRGATRVCARE